MPLGYEIFPGNTTDVTTVEDIVEGMEARFGRAHRVWVMDRGMASAKNLAWLNATGRRYVIGTPREHLRRFAAEMADSTNWRQIREDVEVKMLKGAEGNETFLLCRSAERLKKEQAMHERFSQHIEEGLGSLARRIAKSKRRWIAARSSARSAGSCSATRVRPLVMPSQSPSKTMRLPA
jgi:transposase